jgi:multisubunit Na+/H+ antiporter MnhF subunit
MAEEEHTGLSVLDGVLIVGGGIIAVVVLITLIGFVTSIIWFVLKLVIVVALVAFVGRLIFRRRS